MKKILLIVLAFALFGLKVNTVQADTNTNVSDIIITVDDFSNDFNFVGDDDPKKSKTKKKEADKEAKTGEKKTDKEVKTSKSDCNPKVKAKCGQTRKCCGSKKK